MSKVNANQVGGDHYRSEFQHWDLIEQNGIGYLEGCATKYVTRWRKKNGVQDLEKALHYVEKLQELHNPPCSSLFKPRCARGMATTAEVRRFTEANSLNEMEHDILLCLTGHWTDYGLQNAANMIRELISKAQS